MIQEGMKKNHLFPILSREPMLTPHEINETVENSPASVTIAGNMHIDVFIWALRYVELIRFFRSTERSTVVALRRNHRDPML
jgi:hypothetical protein